MSLKQVLNKQGETVWRIRLKGIHDDGETYDIKRHVLDGTGRPVTSRKVAEAQEEKLLKEILKSKADEIIAKRDARDAALTIAVNKSLALNDPSAAPDSITLAKWHRIFNGSPDTTPPFKDALPPKGKKPRFKFSLKCAREEIYNSHFKETIATVAMNKIGMAEIDTIRTRLVKLSPARHNNIFSYLNTALKRAVDYRHITKEEYKRIEDMIPFLARGAPKKEIKPYTIEEVQKLKVAAKSLGTQYQVFFLLLSEVGLREGEIIALEWSQVDFASKMLTIHQNDYRNVVDTPKGNTTRMAPISDELLAALKSHRHIATKRVLYSANSMKRGKTLGRKGLSGWLEQITEKAGLPKSGHLHRLRHTFCSFLGDAGLTALEISKAIDHKDTKITQRYIHLDAQQNNDKVRAALARSAMPVEPSGASGIRVESAINES